MATRIVRRVYLYAAAFLGLQLLTQGAHSAIGALMNGLVAPPDAMNADQTVWQLNLSIALMIVGAPLWIGHWWWAQRLIAQPEERQSALRRLYGYGVLLVAAIGMTTALQQMLLTLFGVFPSETPAAEIGTALGVLLIDAAIWAYHWRVLASDRRTIEARGPSATLRRWYMVLTQAIGLTMGSIGLALLIHRLLAALITPSIGDTSGVGVAAALLIAGAALWLPHHVWARRLIRRVSSLRDDEAASTLRQVYGALAVTIGAITALGGLTLLLRWLLLALFGSVPWHAALFEHTLAASSALVGGAVWLYHRAQLADEARRTDIAARIDTARRIIATTTAAVGLGALFFGLGGLLGTLLQQVFAADIVGVGWKPALSRDLALTIVALPVYAIEAGVLERLARSAAAEAHALSRRIYLYGALLFGIVAAVVSVVVVVRALLNLLLGVAEPGIADQIARWIGYLISGGLIVLRYALLLRGTSPRASADEPIAIAIIADEPLRGLLIAAIDRELPAATIRAPEQLDPAQLATLRASDVLLVALPDALQPPVAALLRDFGGRRVLLPVESPPLEVAGARSDDALIHATIRILRATPIAPPALPTAPQGAA